METRPSKPEIHITKPEDIIIKPDMGLREKAKKLGHTYIYTSYVATQNLEIARINEEDQARILTEVTNPVDWREQYLRDIIPADLVFTGGDYLKRIDLLGDKAQNILNMLTVGTYSEWGDKRVNELGMAKKEPDIGILSLSLNFPLLEQLKVEGRKVIVFTTYSMVNSPEAEVLRDKARAMHLDLEIVGTGDKEADGKEIAEYVNKAGYETAMMATGPRVLKVFMDANEMHQVDLALVDAEVTGKTVTIIPPGKSFEDYGYVLESQTPTPEYVVTNNGEIHSQIYQRWIRKEILEALNARSPNS